MVYSSSSNFIACRNCKKLKPYSDFILGKNAKLQVRYSPFCKSCRVAIEKKAQQQKSPTINPKDE